MFSNKEESAPSRSRLGSARTSTKVAVTRRGMLGTLAAVACAQEPKPTADSIILLWMAGGMAQTETFDPKKYTPYEPELESKRVLRTFASIPTIVDNIRLSQGLENVAKVMDRGTLIRSHRVGDLGFILHSRHQYHWHTGYAPPQSLAAPHMGAFIARTLGRKHPDMPAFIDIGQNLDRKSVV